MNKLLGGLTGRSGVLRKLNLATLVVQAGDAFRKGNTLRAALLVGTAAVATQYSTASYVVQGLLGIDHLRKRLA